MSDIPNVHDAYALKSKEEINALYDNWASTYDMGFGEAQGYQLPAEVARRYLELGGTSPVLDVGAGTGLVGEFLNSAGIIGIDGVDLSPRMLDVARTKAVYRTLHPQDVTKAFPGQFNRQYNGIISAGTFTLGHVNAEAIGNLLQLAKHDALFVISVNEKHFYEANFRGYLMTIGHQITEVQTTSVRIYDDRASRSVQNDKAYLLSFRLR